MASKEQVFRISALALAIIFVLGTLLFCFFFKYSFLLFFIAIGFWAVILIILEAYFRIQHNIDKSVQNLLNQEQNFQKILLAQNQFMEELDKTKKIYEDILDLLEILIDYLEEMKEKDSRQEEVLRALENLKEQKKEAILPISHE